MFLVERKTVTHSHPQGGKQSIPFYAKIYKIKPLVDEFS